MIEKPVPVEIVRIQYVPVPVDLLHVEAKQTVPTVLTYGEAIGLWAQDRATIEILNGRLIAVQSLEAP